MKFAKYVGLAILPAILLNACNIGGATPVPTQQDLAAIQTVAFQTVAAEIYVGQTQTVAAIPPSSTPTVQPMPTNTNVVAAGISTDAGTFGVTQMPGFTPIAALPTLTPTLVTGLGPTANGCNDGAYIGETIPDGTRFIGGEAFRKAWTIMNMGTCPWDEGYAFVFLAEISTPGLAGYTIFLRKCQSTDDLKACMTEEYTPPGHSQTFVIKMNAPGKRGSFQGFWKLRDDAGNYFGPRVWLCIVVGDVTPVCDSNPKPKP